VTQSARGTAPPCPYSTRKRAWFRQSRTPPSGNVGATRWVARRERLTYGRRVGSHAAAVHDGGRATRRVAPTRRAYSRVRCTSKHGSTPGVPVVGAGSEPAPTISIVAFTSHRYTLRAFSSRARTRLTTASYTASRSPAVSPSSSNTTSPAPAGRVGGFRQPNHSTSIGSVPVAWTFSRSRCQRKGLVAMYSRMRCREWSLRMMCS